MFHRQREILYFVAGILTASFLMIIFDSITPCGRSLGSTLLFTAANLVGQTWDISKSKHISQCPDFPPGLAGKLPFPLSVTPTFDQLKERYGATFVKEGTSAMGGHFKPTWCQAVDRVAIIVPYQDREDNLRQFLYYIHMIMQRQLLDYAIFVVEQASPPSTRFNRGLLLNVGFIEAMRMYHFDCVIFYDVDKVPEDDHASHRCPQLGLVRHMAAYQYRFENMPFRDDYFGGVLAMTSSDVVSINGFSNIFFGYGFEDDEFFQRVTSKNLTIYREHYLLTMYWNLDHSRTWTHIESLDWKYENTSERMKSDGLTSVFYDEKSIHKLPLYTKIVVKFSEKAILSHLSKSDNSLYNLIGDALGFDKTKYS